MTIDFLTPAGGLLVVVVLLPLAAFFGVSRRAGRVREVLGLDEPGSARRLVPVAALLLLGALLGLAAAQPLLHRTATRSVRSDAEVLMAIDISRSMLAQRGVTSPTRLERARAAATELRSALPGVPVGIVTFTNRVLPHLFPSADEDVFKATLDRVVVVEHPPPGTSFLTPVQTRLRNATTFAALSSIARRRFYSPGASRRLLVVLTDGESPRVAATAVGQSLQQAKIESVFVQIWDANEQVFTDGKPEVRYRTDPASRAILDRLAATTQGSVYDEASLGAAAQEAREILGSGPTVAEGYRPDRIALAPYLAVAAFLPLTFLLRRRDR